MRISKVIICTANTGLGAIAAATIAQAVKQSASSVRLEANGVSCDGGRLLDVLSMTIERGDSVYVSAEGEDAVELVGRIGVLLCRGLECELASQLQPT